MDFEPEFIVEDKYWTFGMFAKKDGTINSGSKSIV